MRTAALILGILGGVLAAFLGLKWLNDYNALESALLDALAMGVSIDQAEKLRTAAYFLVSGLATGIVGGILAFKRRGLAGGVIMLVSVVGAVVFAPDSIIFSGLLALGAVFALVSHRQTQTRPQAGRVVEAA
jgi:hypothetical protein